MKSKNYLFKASRTRKKYVRLLRRNIKYINKTGPKIINNGITADTWTRWITSRFIRHGNKKSSRIVINKLIKSIYYNIKKRKKIYWVITLPASHQKPDFIFSSVKKNFFTKNKKKWKKKTNKKFNNRYAQHDKIVKNKHEKKIPLKKIKVNNWKSIIYKALQDAIKTDYSIINKKKTKAWLTKIKNVKLDKKKRLYKYWIYIQLHLWVRNVCHKAVKTTFNHYWTLAIQTKNKKLHKIKCYL